MGRRITISFVSIAGFIALWIALAFKIADPQILPGPDALVGPFLAELASGELIYHLSQTLLRVVWAFALAMILGTSIGFVMGASDRVNDWLDPWLVVFLNLPALVLIVLCYLWIGLNETAAIAAVTLNKVPNVAVVIREGTRARSPDTAALAQVYRMGRVARIMHVDLPQLAPFVAAAARSGIAVIWKIVLVVELLGRSNGVGFQIHLYFQLFDVGMVLVYAFSFIAVMLVVEWCLLQPWERSSRRWRQA
ncbi:MAG: ABC transporter permease [Rhodobacteraceae bacterium]|nr:ABC transporter permease [Paracoccaceae bacterium]